MKVTKTLIPTNKTQDEIDTMMNNLMVDLQDFSSIACLEGRAFGVEIYNEKCDTFNINTCMRSRMIEGLISSQETTEKKLGYSLTPRYESYKIDSQRWVEKHQLKRGIESVNVVQATTSVDGFAAQTINYYVDSGTVVDAGSYLYVDFNRDLVWNVDDIIIRDSDGDRILIDDTVSNYITVVGDNWRIKLTSNQTNADDTVYAQDSRFMVVEFTPPTLDNGGTLYPVYPDTNQIIPCARAVETLDNDDVRYWFHPWVLVDERRFSDTDIDLLSGEFYKLLQEIEFKEFYESTQYPVVKYLDCDGAYQTATSQYVRVEITDSPRGILAIDLDYWLINDRPSDYYDFESVTVYYKTNPDLIGFDGEEMTVSIAIANLTAAELPLKMCKCEIDKGFIFEAQRSFGSKFVMIDGTEKQNIRYGDKVGQKVYFDYIDRLPKKRKRVKI
jgi:hypothetical protein